MRRNWIAGPVALLVALEAAGTSLVTNAEIATGRGSETAKERAPEMQKPEPQPPQITFPFPFFPSALLPEVSTPPQLPFTFPFPFLFPSFTSRPSAGALDLPLLPLDSKPSEQKRRRKQIPDKKKQKKKKKKKAKIPKSPKQFGVYQRDDDGIDPQGPESRSGFAIENGGYRPTYLVEVTRNDSNQAQTIIADRPISATEPVPAESVPITNLSGSIISDNANRSPPATRRPFRKIAAPDHARPSEAAERESPGAGKTGREIMSEEVGAGR